ncbi:pyridoxal phosphate-dependent aminotransferase [bacterium]|nr:pyridoxal phosphate-dependent aminotransferase [bacterium]
MSLQTPSLEAWFNRYEAGAAHSLGSTMVQTWKGADLAPYFPEGWGPGAFEYGYVPTPGSYSLRALIAAELGLEAEQIFLTAGATEANHTVLRGMIRPGDSVVLQDPLYYQFADLAAELGAEVRRWTLSPDPYEPVDIAALEALIDDSTRLVVLNTPHNPTGRCLDEKSLREIARLVEARPRTHLLVDEIYRGVGVDLAPSAVALSDRAIVTNAVSKRWCLPGLRLGWVATRSQALQACLPYHEYATCCVSRLSEQVIEALWPRREELFEANQAIAERNRRRFGAWLEQMKGLLEGVVPPVGVVTLIWPQASNDRQLAAQLREEFDLFCLPGSTLGYPGALRVGFGHRDPATLDAALTRLEEGLRQLAPAPSPMAGARP